MYNSIFILFLIIVACCLLYNGLFNSMCSKIKISEEIFPKLCWGNRQETFFELNYFKYTNLCNILCGKDVSIDCISNNNKDSVFSVSTSHIKFVLKQASNKAVSMEDEDQYLILNEKEFNNMVAVHTLSVLGNENMQDLKSIKANFHENKLEKNSSFWDFMNDQEFMLSYLFEPLQIFPKLYGICNKFYGIEFATPLLEKYSRSSKIVKLDQSIELLNYIDKLNHIWIEPLHLCDVKFDHFGWTSKNEVLFLDLDSVETDSSLKFIFNSTPHCIIDDDCSYFDCYSKCLPTYTCSNRLNTNLQVLCSKIFLGVSDDSFFYNNGILAYIQLSELLKEALQLCSTNPGMTPDVLIDLLQSEKDSLTHQYEL